MAFRLFCRKQGPGGDYCVTVRAGHLFLALPDDSDAYQLWYKEDHRSGFMLVNKATNKATRHLSYVVSIASNQTRENAQWKLVPVPCPTPTLTPAPAPVYTQPSNMIYCLAGDAQYCIAIKAGNIVLACPNPNDSAQQWYKDDTQSAKAGSFMLVNKSNFQADQPLQLANRPITPDKSFLWTESETDGYGFTYLVTATNSGLAMDARSRDGKEAHDDKYLSFSKNLKGDNQKWIFIS